jgi:hypothetical protein
MEWGTEYLFSNQLELTPILVMFHWVVVELKVNLGTVELLEFEKHHHS